MWLALLVVLLACATVAAGCTTEDLVLTREPASLRLVAADSVGPLAEELAEAYEAEFPWVTIDVTVRNSARAEAALRDGDADIGLLSWIGAKGDAAPIWSTPWTRDGIAVVLHPSTQLPGNSLGHLQEVFRGRLQEWEGVVYAVVSREDGSGTRDAFEAMVMDYHPVTLNAAVAPLSSGVVEAVAATPGAIGYVSSLRLGAPDSSDVRILAVDGVTMNPANVADGRYVLWRQLYLAAPGEPAEEVRAFAQWLLGPEGQTITSVYVSDPGGRR